MASSSRGSNPIWKKIWALSMPGKVKTFVWKALHGAIPVKSTLTNRHIGTNNQCPICHGHPEDLKHLLFDCAPAQEMWKSLQLEHEITTAYMVDIAGSAILEELLDISSGHYPNLLLVGMAEVVAIATWYLWWIRRTVTHKERTPPVAGWKLSVLALCTNFTKAAQKPEDREIVKWKKPDICQVKLNVDASFHSEEGEGATGAIIRD